MPLTRRKRGVGKTSLFAGRRATMTVSSRIPDFGSEALADAFGHYEERRAEYLRCGGMHSDSVKKIVQDICEGKVKGPGVAMIAPALYEGIPEFLDKTMDAMGEVAVYASLYMGLFAVAGLSGFYPRISRASYQFYYLGVFGSMFCNTGVVFMAVIYPVAAVGHFRDSDKLVYLWRSRYSLVAAFFLFSMGTVLTMFGLMWAVSDTVQSGGACFTAYGDPTLSWADWWEEWTGAVGIPSYTLGQGVIYPKGEKIYNPWIVKANELNLTAPDGVNGLGAITMNRDLSEKYKEFMMDVRVLQPTPHPNPI